MPPLPRRSPRHSRQRVRRRRAARVHRRRGRGVTASEPIHATRMRRWLGTSFAWVADARGTCLTAHTIHRRSSNTTKTTPQAMASRRSTGALVQVTASPAPSVAPATAWATASAANAVVARAIEMPAARAKPTCPMTCQTPPGTYFPSCATRKLVECSRRRPVPRTTTQVVASPRAPLSCTRHQPPRANRCREGNRHRCRAMRS